MSNEPTKLYTIPKLTELMDKTTLQQIQDWAAMTAGVPILIRDADGNPVTVPSLSSEFCDLISGPGHTNPDCIKSNKRAAIKAAKTGKPVKYICHAGLTQFAAPINISGQFMGTIVIGDRPMKPLDAVDVEKLANKFSINAETLKMPLKMWRYGQKRLWIPLSTFFILWQIHFSPFVIRAIPLIKKFEN